MHYPDRHCVDIGITVTYPCDMHRSHSSLSFPIAAIVAGAIIISIPEVRA